MDKPVEIVDSVSGAMVAKRREAALRVWRILHQAHADAHCALHHGDPWQLLVATILSAQCTDERVNQVTPLLFARYPDPAALAQADPAHIEALIRPTGFFRNKARHLQAAAQVLFADHDGKVPNTLAELVKLPGVGRKTANVVLGVAFGQSAMVVDTHVKRIAFRLGWTRSRDPLKIEAQLCCLLPRETWTQTAHLLIFHGRRICKAPIPWCSRCPVGSYCPQCGVAKSH